VTADNLQLQTRVDGVLRQDANTHDLIFDIPGLIETISAGLTLEPGLEFPPSYSASLTLAKVANIPFTGGGMMTLMADRAVLEFPEVVLVDTHRRLPARLVNSPTCCIKLSVAPEHKDRIDNISERGPSKMWKVLGVILAPNGYTCRVDRAVRDGHRPILVPFFT
jgi:hypothetical protein